ncbi:MAG: hypothetical protein APF77_16095 [Clostridia bacterium BRH_c25]|nr:MAG: hypothetical protein APF77_16095 [Clostridia bacterium BRH_c25]
MNSNESIIASWRPKHEKGIFAYVIPYAIRFFIAVTLTTVIIFLIRNPNDISVVFAIVANNAMLCGIVVLGRVFEWFKREKEYKRILDLFEMANKCPVCSAETSPEDKVCPSCGIFLS